MSERHAGFAQGLAAAVLEAPGETASALRRRIFEISAALGARATPSGDLSGVPRDLAVYVDKVARHAHRVTDEDVQALRQAGFSEDAIFELTLSAALAAATFRLEQGLKALRGGAP